MPLPLNDKQAVPLTANLMESAFWWQLWILLCQILQLSSHFHLFFTGHTNLSLLYLAADFCKTHKSSVFLNFFVCQAFFELVNIQMLLLVYWQKSRAIA